MITTSTKLHKDPLFVGATRPPMRWGVTYAALLGNVVFTMEVFLLTRNLLALLVALPIHLLSAALCASDARCFDLWLMWLKTRGVALLANVRYWGGSSYSPFVVAPPDVRGRRRAPVGSVPIAWQWKLP
jgi:type IV secretion system protein VirB3